MRHSFESARIIRRRKWSFKYVVFILRLKIAGASRVDLRFANLNFARGGATSAGAAMTVAGDDDDDDGGAVVTLPNRAASTSAGVGSSSVFINVVLCYACRDRVRNTRRSSTDTLRRVPAGCAPRYSPFAVSRR